MNARWPRLLLAPAMLVLLVACGSAPKKPEAASTGKAVAGKRAAATAAVPAGCTGVSPYAPAQEDPSTRGHYTAGGLYKPGVSDTTPDHVPDVACIPEPLVVDEPRSAIGNRSPYTVLGKKYYVLDRPKGYVEKGTASYYGAKFHGRRTSNQEVYDMYAFSAAHKTLPLPSFARVTNLDNGQSVVVRVNDRGPFHDGRVIDLSYAAAVKLGIVARGTGRVEVRALSPGDPDLPRLASAPAAPRRGADAIGPAVAAASAATSAATTPAVTVAAPTPATGLDHLVQALPSATGTAASVPVAVVAAVAPAGSTPVRVGDVPASIPVSPGPPPQSGSYAPAGSTPVAVAAPVLQVASFSSLDNARRALDRLVAAGIAGARLDDVVAGGRTFWRLRVVPGGSDAMELASRIAGLGFGTPQLVRE